VKFSRIIGKAANLFACKSFSGSGVVDKLVDQIRLGGIFVGSCDLATLLRQAQLYKNINKINYLNNYAGGGAQCGL
jgi:hypothetical protein